MLVQYLIMQDKLDVNALGRDMKEAITLAAGDGLLESVKVLIETGKRAQHESSPPFSLARKLIQQGSKLCCIYRQSLVKTSHKLQVNNFSFIRTVPHHKVSNFTRGKVPIYPKGKLGCVHESIGVHLYPCVFNNFALSLAKKLSLLAT